MDKKNKIVLFIPRPKKHTYNVELPIPMLKLASMLDLKKFDVKIFVAKPGVNYAQQIADEAEDAFLIGVSALTGYSITDAIEVIKLIKEKNSTAPIVWGGWHPSIVPEQTIKSEFVDIIIRAQGERSFKEVVDCVYEGKPLGNIQSISFKRGGKIIHNPLRPFEDINNFPPLPYHLVNVKEYLGEIDGMRSLFYITSQGCPFQCKFCAEPIVFKQRWSMLSNDRILNDWEQLTKEYGIGFFLIGDDNFFVSEEKVVDFCKKLIKRKLNIKWGRVCGRARQMLAFSDSTWQLIKDAGCTDIHVGFESGCQEILDFISKQLTTNEMKLFVEKTRQFKIRLIPAIILGIPTEEFRGKNQEQINILLKRQWDEMINLVNKCYSKELDYDEFRIYPYLPYPGNALFELSCELGYKEPKALEEWGIIKSAPWIPDKMKQEIDELTNFVFPYARDDYKVRHIKKFMLFQNFFHYACKWRLRHNFFRFPLEYKLYKFYTDKRTRKTGISATERN